MPRLMSVALTEQAVIERRKTVTRRLGWRHAHPGMRLTLVRKVMGRRRKDGTVEPLVRLAEVEVVAARTERLWAITDEDIARECVPGNHWHETYLDTGLPTPNAWVVWFCEQFNCRPDAFVSRIEWRYLDTPTQTAAQPGGGSRAEADPAVDSVHSGSGACEPSADQGADHR